jgi:DNA polymerase bacteriophage-type
MTSLDYETRSTCDLKKHGAYLYSTHPSTGVQCMAYRDGKGVQLWLPNTPLPELSAPLVAFNAQFERLITKNVLNQDRPISDYRCTAARARAAGCPGSLEDAAAFLGLPVQKDMQGHKAMMQTCKPHNGKWVTDPALLAQVYKYCKNDVVVEEGIAAVLPPMSEREQKIWELDQSINDRGIPVDTALCEGAVKIREQLKDRLQRRTPELTEDMVQSPTQVKRLKEWFKSKGVEIASLAADLIPEMIASDIPQVCKDVLALRQAGAPAAVAKYQAVLDRVSPDGNVRGQYLYCGGGTTGRWSGAGGAQFQNFKRGQVDNILLEAITNGDLEVLEALTDQPVLTMQTAVRQIVCAPPGYLLVPADFTAIEARVCAWFCGAASLQHYIDFDNGKGPEPYVIEAAKIFQVPVSEVTKSQRQIGKITTLSCQYGTGAVKCIGMIKQQAGITVDIGQGKKIVFTWRRNNPEIVKSWKSLGYAACQVICGNRSIAKYRGVEFEMYGKALRMKLLSGRCIYLHDAKVDKDDNIQYTNNKGFKETIWGGVLLNWCIQGMSRDIQADAMMRIAHNGLTIIGHTHDEIIALVTECEAKDARDIMTKLMATVESWLGTCPIIGPAWISRRWIH